MAITEKKTISTERFYAQNQVKRATEKFVVSRSFVTEDGEPIEWELRPLTFEENERIMNDPHVTIEEKDRRTGTKTYRTIETEYMAAICAHSVVFPDLGDRGLQNSYSDATGKRINSKVALIKVMLTAGELARLSEKVVEVSDLGENNELDSLVAEAKN